METTNLNQNQPVPIVTPQPTQPKRRQPGRWLSVLAVLVIVGAGLTYWLVRNNTEGVAAAPSAVVEITASGFVPATITLQKGQDITWVNKDTAPHQVASDPYPADNGLAALNSGEPLAQGESYTTSFQQSGTYTYHDELHPNGLQATVVIQ